MAGRPVSARGGGLSGQFIGVIAMTIVSVVFLVLYVLEYTTNQGLIDKAARAEKAVASYGNPLPYYEQEATARSSNAFAIMDEDRKRVSSLVSGQADAVAMTIEAQAKELLAAAALENAGVVASNDTLMSVIKKLSKAAKDSRDSADVATRSLQEEQDQSRSLTTQLDMVRKDFEAQITDMDKKLRSAEDEKVKTIAAKDEQITNIQNELNAVQQQLLTLQREGLKSSQLKDVEIARLIRQIGDLQEKLKAVSPETFDPKAILTKADGRILRAIPGSDVVYISLGQGDRIKVGMGFEVYSQTREVPKGLRGKASIEVVTIMQDTAECRVMRSDDSAPILEGDIIVNIAFERGHQPKFFVAGEFDLNHDGIQDFDGKDKVVSIIRAWGGQVLGELDESVNYVVIGTGPVVPQLPPNASDVVREQAQERALESSRYKSVIDRARSIFIPVITQDQFLFLTGYAGESAFTRR